MHCAMGSMRKSTRCDWRSVSDEARDDDVVPPCAATRGDLPALGHVLAEAFRHDPFHRWVFPSERAWRRGSHRLFTALLEDDLSRATILTTADCEGVAIWHGPGYASRPWWRELTFNARMLRLIGPRAPLIGHGMSRLARLHPRQAHWYLAHLGTHPARQGKGIGSSLLSPLLAVCDANGQAAYLEASCERNLPFYQRHGFEVVAPFQLPRGPRVYRMCRPPSRKPPYRRPSDAVRRRVS
jgi:GNAT superfamily N-acetyltransferase